MFFFAQRNSTQSTDFQAGIRGRVRIGHEEHAARWCDDVQRRHLLLQIPELSDLSQIVEPHFGSIWNFNADIKGGRKWSRLGEPISDCVSTLAAVMKIRGSPICSQADIDLSDRTAGHAGWMVVKPYPTQTSNCILPHRCRQRTAFNRFSSQSDVFLTPHSLGSGSGCNDVHLYAFTCSAIPYPGRSRHRAQCRSGLSAKNPQRQPPAPCAAVHIVCRCGNTRQPVRRDWATATGRADGYWQGNVVCARVQRIKPAGSALHGYLQPQPDADLHQSGWLASHGLYEERLQHDGDHRRIPQLRRYGRMPTNRSSRMIRACSDCASLEELVTSLTGTKGGGAIRRLLAYGQ